MVYNRQVFYMKNFKVLLILGLLAFAFIQSACEKDHGETPYENVNDNDWKKKVAPSSDSDIHETETVLQTMNK